MSKTIQFRVLDFDCPSCTATVERALSNVDGVHDVKVHYATGRVEIEYEGDDVTPETFETTIEQQGYTPQPA